MDVGARVWVQDASDALVWVEAQVLALHKSSDETISAVTVAVLSSGRQCDVTLSFAGGECRNVLLLNQGGEQEADDLVALPHLHEASILHALRLRYARNAIYTRIGEILISINPFKKLPTLYTRDVVAAYAPEAESRTSPHLFAIARAAYVDVVRNARNQSILISGESGAGKTEATKIMMKYFAETCGTSRDALSSSPSSSSSPSIETQVLQSNPILEAFGNARTVRNDNSSRFGKFIELQFDARHAIVGARIRTYLLEKIRVINQAPHERNFHVFYELVAASTAAHQAIAAAAPAWKLHAGAGGFRILNQSGCLTRRDGVDDAAQFDRTLRAMQQIGLRESEIVDVLSVVAALLHLGNVAFAQRPRENVQEAVVPAGHEPFSTAASLLRVAPEQLAAAMTQRQLTTATETLTVALDAAQAEHTRNALVMECYRLLFAWLVGKINAQILCEAPSLDCIGLLDIFGFEDMAVNSFEQLCINYANEALQHQFNEFVFAQEQQLYAAEGLTWRFVDFPNNSACLELFEKKPIGLFSLCDQECLFPQGTDRALLAKLYAEFEKKLTHAHFQAPASGWQRQSHFVVAHYAGKVSYAVDGFLAKNKDAFCETAASLLATSSNLLIQSLGLAVAPPPTESRKNKALAAVSVGTQFKTQLGELLERIRATAPHYVRCVKPNDESKSDALQSARALEQLRSGGVLEAVRVARAGFPVRMVHAQFLDRYQRVLLFQNSRSKSKTPLLERCLNHLSALVPSAVDGVSLGRTRVFFRRQPYEQLEQFRAQTLSRAAVAIQKILRGSRVRRAFVVLRKAVLRLQARLRGAQARALVLWLRRSLGATLVQRHTRRWLAQTRYSRFRYGVLVCQSHFRRRRDAREVQARREQRAALRLETFWRCHHDRRRFQRLRCAVLALQCALRRRVARKRLVALRLESRNVSKLQQDNLKLQTELAMLRMALLQMQAQYVPEPFADVPIAVVVPEPTPMQPTPVFFKTRVAEPPSSNQHCERESLKPRSDLAVDLSSDYSPHRVTLQAPHSVAPPVRRGSLPSTQPPASTTKAEFMAHAPRRRSRSSQQLVRKRHNQKDTALDAKVRQLRDELKEASRAANPEEEQEQIVKRFVASQLLTTTTRGLQPRLSGTFELDLKDCDNNSTVDNDDDETAEEATPTQPPAFKRRASRPTLAPPLTACAPTSKFAWSHSNSSLHSDAPLSARPASQALRPRYFGDLAGGLHATDAALSSRSSALSSGVGSVPRWSKDSQCKACRCKFTFLTRRHHCRSCGNSFCFEHSTRRMTMPELGYADAQRVCDDCFEWRSLEARDSHSSQFGRLTEVRPSDLLLRQASSLSIASVGSFTSESGGVVIREAA